jgi:hypothetical protein
MVPHQVGPLPPTRRSRIVRRRIAVAFICPFALLLLGCYYGWPVMAGGFLSITWFQALREIKEAAP